MARRFAKICGNCRQKAMEISAVKFDVSIDHDGKQYDVHLDALSVPKCAKCGAISLDNFANEQIDIAFRQKAGLLTSAQIKRGRADVGFPNQQEFAKCFGVSASTVSRWENGSQIQQTFHDGVLRAFFDLESFREYLANLHGVAYSGSTTIVTMRSDQGGTVIALSEESFDAAPAENETNVGRSLYGQTDGYEPISD